MRKGFRMIMNAAVQANALCETRHQNGVAGDWVSAVGLFYFKQEEAPNEKMAHLYQMQEDDAFDELAERGWLVKQQGVS